MATPLQKPDIVIFDMDGTTVRHVNPLLLSCLEFLDNAIYAVARLFSRKKEITDFSHDPAAPRGMLVHRMLHKFRRKPVEQIVQPCPGIYLLLNYLRDQNIRLAIASNGLGKGYGHDILQKFKLEQYFEQQIFREDVSKSKPHPDGILRVLNLMDNTPEPGDVVWHIGDRHKDIKAAIAADKISDCKIIPYAYGLDAAIEILKNNIGSDHIIMNYADFYTKLRDEFASLESGGAGRHTDARKAGEHKSEKEA